MPSSGAIQWGHPMGPANGASQCSRVIGLGPGDTVVGGPGGWDQDLPTSAGARLAEIAANKPQFFSRTDTSGVSGKVYRLYLTGSCDTTRATHSSDTTGLENPSVLLHPLSPAKPLSDVFPWKPIPAIQPDGSGGMQCRFASCSTTSQGRACSHTVPEITGMVR